MIQIQDKKPKDVFKVTKTKGLLGKRLTKDSSINEM